VLGQELLECRDPLGCPVGEIALLGGIAGEVEQPCLARRVADLELVAVGENDLVAARAPEQAVVGNARRFARDKGHEIDAVDRPVAGQFDTGSRRGRPRDGSLQSRKARFTRRSSTE